MSSSQKIKGSQFERDIAKELNEKVKLSSWKRVPGSGAIGTIVKESFLTGDVNGTLDRFPKKFKIEAKVGYGGAKQLTLKKEWLEKIRREADSDYAIPLVAGKFLGSRSSVKTFIVMETDVFAEMLNYITELDIELENALAAANDCDSG